MGLPYYAGLISLVVFVAGIGIFVATYEVTTYEDERNSENQLWSETTELENRFDTIKEAYKVGNLSNQECYDSLIQLKIDTQNHLRTIKEKIGPLNTSHIFKHTQQLLVYLDEEIELMTSIIN